MRQTPSKMSMTDVVTIDTIVFEIVGGVALIKAPPPSRIVNFFKYRGSDRVKNGLMENQVYVNKLD